MSTTTTTTATTTKTALTKLIGMPSDAATEFEKQNRPSSHTGEEDRHMAEKEAQRRIRELETQVNFYKVQTSGTTERLAEYDEEIRRLHFQVTNNTYTPRTSRSSRSSDDMDKSLSPTQLPIANGNAEHHHHHAQPPAPVQPPQQQQQPPPPQQQTSRLFNLSSLLHYGRRPSAMPPAPTPPPAPARTKTPSVSAPQAAVIHHLGQDPDETVELQNALNREQSLRKAAETQLSQASTELEELTVQLFSQANEMVAQERKARARLEERVAVLERRDVEKRKRLDRLEKAMERVERVRKMVG